MYQKYQSKEAQQNDFRVRMYSDIIDMTGWKARSETLNRQSFSHVEATGSRNENRHTHTHTTTRAQPPCIMCSEVCGAVSFGSAWCLRRFVAYSLKPSVASGTVVED